MNSKKGLLLAMCVLLAADSASAAMKQGASLLGIQIREGIGDYVSQVDSFGLPGYILSLRHAEMGVQAQFWHFFSDEYAMALSGGFGFAKETDTPGPTADPGSGTFRDTYTSWLIRLGGDRVASINDRFHVFGGPGVQLWGGKVKSEEAGAGSIESQTAMRFALDGRLGAMMNWTETFGMVGHYGHYFGYSSAKEKGAQAKWTASGPDGSMGFFFAF